MLEWDVIDRRNIKKDFQVKQFVIEKFIYENYSPITSYDIKNIIEITGFNFNNIKKLMWINHTKNDGTTLSEASKLEYLQDWLETEFERISYNLKEILKKSSIIGEIFCKYILEDVNGFHILGVSSYLDELENEEIFISKYLSRKDYYKFITYDIFNTVRSTVSAAEKNEWEKIIRKYYFKIYFNNQYPTQKIEILSKIKEISITLNDFEIIYKINHVLLNEYIKMNEFSKSITIINELVNQSSNKEHVIFKEYLLSLKLKMLIIEGSYKEALEITNHFKNDAQFKGSESLLKFYHIKCLYDCGDVDKAYLEIKELILELKLTISRGLRNQAIYPLAFSMMASIQNHLNVDDEGQKYYMLALNYAYNKMDEKDIYFDILKKCEMFINSNKAIENLKKCIIYYRKSGNVFQASRVYFNLATEMMFNSNKYKREINCYLNYAKKIFGFKPDENLAYAKNNLAIFYILFEDNLKKAIIELEESLFVGLSNFTYMTIYLNLSMCYFKLYGKDNKKFKENFMNFLKYENLIENRDNNTKYEVMYRDIAQLIFVHSSQTLKQEILKCQELLAEESVSVFFYPLIEDIRNRLQNIKTSKSYMRNAYFYRRMNELEIFVAEFRFWD